MVTMMDAELILADYCRCDVLIVGVGNDLFGDDGFGRAVARRLVAEALPPWACVLDAGTSVRQILFDLVLSDRKPRTIVIVDAVDLDRTPGEIFLLPAHQLPAIKLDDFSMHQLPTSNLLRELQTFAGVEVKCVVCQVAFIPAQVQPGLSLPVDRAVEKAAQLLLAELRQPAESCKEKVTT